MRLRSTQCAKTLVCCVTYERLKAQANGVRVRGGPACLFRLAEKLVVDNQGLLHTGDYAI